MRFFFCFAYERGQTGSQSHGFMPGTGADFWHVASFPTKRAWFWPEKTNSSHRNLTVTALTLKSLVLRLGWAASAVGMTSGTCTLPSFERGPRPGKLFLLHGTTQPKQEKILLFWTMFMGHRHVQNYLHLLHKTSWESCRSSDILCNIFPGKNRRQKWEICHSKEADLKLSVLISTLRTSWKHKKGRLSTICMQDRICLFFLTLVSVLLYCFMSQELHKKMTGYKSQGSFKSL